MDIHKHTILTKLGVGGRAWDSQMAWVKGYILALEDVLGDLDNMSMKPYPTGHTRAKVLETLTQARATLVSLQKMEDNSTKE